MRRRTATSRPRPGGFTLIELLITIFVIAVLMGLLLVGFSRAIRAARRTAGVQDVHSMTMAVEQFRGDFNFIPPLVKDGYADTPDGAADPLLDVGRNRKRPFIYSTGDTEDLEFLRGESGDPRYRFSIYSLPYYLMGALGEEVDGLAGPGAKIPLQDGSFDPMTNKTYEPLYQTRTGNLEFVNAEEGRVELRDAKGVAYRYYRWSPGRTNSNEKGILNLPPLVEAGKDLADLGAAKYAIVAAGPDGVFGDIETSSYPGGPPETLAMIEDALGKRFKNDAAAEAAAREDNIVGVGR